ncbi:hypothetical protein FSP39_005290 [Pinctada imbricata]|uniref:Sulfotransferase domain-containing protein n=1 Tax=Pinctada imbricata TaxID=66713 RepID=A0AA89CAK9_PINIB|nr:hypothetical protein FSP39_005290 [Pinctada imbricata]
MLQVGRIEYIGAHVPDFPIEYREMGEVASLKSPRTMHSHLWYSMLPKQLIKENRGKVIALIRNPKDAFVSFWHFNNNREEQSLNIDVFADLYMKGNCEYME